MISRYKGIAVMQRETETIMGMDCQIERIIEEQSRKRGSYFRLKSIRSSVRIRLTRMLVARGK
jgi:hypothetical protein